MSSAYVDLEQVVPIVVGARCTPGALLCSSAGRDVELRAPGLGGASEDGDLWDTEPRRCRGADATMSGSAGWDSPGGASLWRNRGDGFGAWQRKDAIQYGVFEVSFRFS